MSGWRERLREAIDRTNRKRWFIAEEAGINPATLSRILNGHMQPSFESVVRIAHVAGVTVCSILDETPGAGLTPYERQTLIEAAQIMIRITYRKEDEAKLHRLLSKLM